MTLLDRIVCPVGNLPSSSSGIFGTSSDARYQCRLEAVERRRAGCRGRDPGAQRRHPLVAPCDEPCLALRRSLGRGLQVTKPHGVWLKTIKPSEDIENDVKPYAGYSAFSRTSLSLSAG